MRKTFSLPVAATAAGGGVTPPPPADTVDNIEHSVRFNSADTPSLSRTFSAGNQKKWTWSGWVKRNKLGTYQTLFSGDPGSNYTLIWLLNNDKLAIDLYNSTESIQTEAVFRDPSAWYHFVVAVDTTQAANADRVKMYVNGVQQTTTGTITQNRNTFINGATQHDIGKYGAGSAHKLDATIANYHFVDGYQKAPTDFAFTDSDNVWQPKAYSGSYGTNGFHLDFADTSSATALGNDVSGNNNDWTPSGLVAGPAYTANSWSTEFDGTGDYLSIAANTVFDIGGAKTWECWFKADTISTNKLLLGSASNHWLNIGYTSLGGAAGKIGFSARNSNTSSYVPVNSTTTITAGVWYHVAATWDGTYLKLYLNGSLEATSSDQSAAAWASNNGNAYEIGAYGASSSTSFDGLISNVRVTDSVVYTSNFTPPTTALTATDDTVLLTCQDQTVRDNSNLGHSVTKNGDVAVVNEGPFNGYSGDFSSGGSLSIADSADFTLGTNDFTLETWCYFTSTSFQLFLGQNDGNVSGSSIDVRYSNGTVTAYAFSGSNDYSATGSAALNVWNHVAWVRDGSTLRLFINGSQTGTANIGTNSVNDSGTTFRIGNGASKFSNVRLTNGQALYTADFTPPTADLTTTSQGATASNVKLLTCQDSTFADNSGQGEAITANGNAAVSTSAPFANHHSVEFDGTGDYLSIADSTGFDLGLSSEPFTLEAWVYPSSLGTDTIFGRGGGTAGWNASNGHQYLLFYNAGTDLYFQWWNGSAVQSINSAGALTANVWAHLAVVYDGTDVKLYKNGTLLVTGSSATFTKPSASNVTRIGDMPSGSAEWDGKISNVRVTKGQALYTAAFTPSTTPLTTTSQGAKAGNVKLLTCNGSTIVDTSGKNITANGNASTISVNPHTDKYSVEFDGTGDFLSIPASSDLNVGSGDFTAEAWVYPTGYGEIVGAFNLNSPFYGWLWSLSFNSSGGKQILWLDGTQPTSTTVVPLNQWSHIAFTKSGSTVRYFLNGVLDGSFTNSSGATTSGQAVHIGADSNSLTSPGRNFTGKISNLRVTNGQALYTSNFLPSKEDLTTTSQGATASNVKLLTCQSYKIQDNSDSDHTITVNGDAAPSTDAPFVTSGAGSFDGTGDYLNVAANSDFALSGAYTIETWINFESAPTTTVFFGLAGTSTTGNAQLVYSGGALYWQTRGTGANQTSYTWSPATDTWYHIALTWNGSNSFKMFIDGQQVATNTVSPTINQNGINIGGASDGYGVNGYMSNFRISSGLARYTSNFTPPTGDFDPTDQDTTFLALQGNTTDDLSGNDHAVTANGNAATTTVSPFEPVDGSDAMLDSPTNYGSGDTVRGNYCTVNPLDKASNITLSNGNLDFSSSGNSWHIARSTFAMSSGKWYWEVTMAGGTNLLLGLSRSGADLDTYLGGNADGWGYNAVGGDKYHNSSFSTYGAGYAVNDVIGIAFDADNGTLVFYKNGVSQGTAYTGLTSGPYFPTVSTYASSGTANFGQQPFKYPLAGYKSLCSTNLPTPAVADGSTEMDVVLYTGDGQTTQTVALPFEPGLTWQKMRSGSSSHYLHDVIRGFSASNGLRTNGGNAEGFNSAYYSLSQSGSNLTFGNVGAGNEWNTNGSNYVIWTWDGGSSTVTNTDGTITSQVRANPTAGFSIVKFTDTAGTPTVGHGLNSAPSFLITKSSSGPYSWWIYHASLGAGQYMSLNTNNGAASDISWGSAPTSSVFTAPSGFFVNGQDYIVYAFAPVEGFSAFGSYTGNGSTDGPFVYTGFKPAYVLYKRTNASGNHWGVMDSTRDPSNVADAYLQASSNAAESSTAIMDLLSNGFKLRIAADGTNGNGSTYIYAAFAEHPFKTSRAR